MVILKESVQNGNTLRELIRTPTSVISNFQIKGQKNVMVLSINQIMSLGINNCMCLTA